MYVGLSYATLQQDFHITANYLSELKALYLKNVLLLHFNHIPTLAEFSCYSILIISIVVITCCLKPSYS